MKKSIFNILASIVIALVMVILSMPICFAADYSGTGEGDFTWEFDSATGTMTISGTGDMEGSFYRHWKVKDNTQSNSKIDLSPMIKKIIISEGITSIGDSALVGLTEMTSVDIPNTVTKIKRLAFADAWKLESITIPDGVTTLGYYCFERCKALKTVIIPDSVTEIGCDAFRGCIALETVVISNNVEEIPEDCFLGCKSLVNVQLGSNVKIVENRAFKECSSLKQVILPESVERIESDEAFGYCDTLEKVYIPGGIKHVSYNTFCSNDSDVKSSLTDIYFGGSKEAWDALNQNSNIKILNATVHYNSKPSDMNDLLENLSSNNEINDTNDVGNESNSSANNSKGEVSDKSGTGPVIGAVAGVVAFGAGAAYIFIKKKNKIK